MMWFKRNLPLLLGCVIFLFFVGLSVVLLQQAKRAQGGVEIKHRELEDRRKQYQSKHPYPSQQSLDTLKTQTEQLQGYYEKLWTRLPKTAKSYPTVSPLEFKGALEGRVNAIRSYCQNNGVEVPASFTAGFVRYLGGGKERPKEADTPHLARQLDIVEHLIRLLVESRVQSIGPIKRTYLDGEDKHVEDKLDGATWNRDPNLIYESQSLDLSFRCTDEQVKAILNKIARSTNIVMLVRMVNIRSDPANPRPTEVSAPSPAATRPGPPGAGFPLPSGARQPPMPQTAAAASATDEPVPVTGNEMVDVYLRLDVVELKQPEEPGAEGEKKAAAESGGQSG